MDRLEAMAVFRSVAELGGLAAAARQLNLSPVAVTRAVAGLEARLGARLLTRTTRRVRLTEAGARYLADCDRILAEVEEAEAAAAGSHAAPRGTLRVTAPTQFGRLHIGPALPGFLDRYPEVAVELVLLDRVVDLVEEGIDVGLRIGELGTSSLVAIRLGQVRRVVVGAPALLERQGVPATPRDLASYQLIVPTSLSSGETWRFVDPAKGDRPITVKLTSRLKTSQPEVAIDAAIAGFGLTRVPIYQVALPLARGSLRIVLDAFEEPPVPVSLITVEGRRSAAKVRAFIDHVAPELRAALRDLPGGD
jgi:DNA-binding transcriptional LysR family regulator